MVAKRNETECQEKSKEIKRDRKEAKGGVDRDGEEGGTRQRDGKASAAPIVNKRQVRNRCTERNRQKPANAKVFASEALFDVVVAEAFGGLSESCLC